MSKTKQGSNEAGLSAWRQQGEPEVAGTTQLVGIDSIHPHPKNPRAGDLSRIKQSMQAHGFYGVIVASLRTRNIVAGSHRWEARRDLGFKDIPTYWLDLTPEQEMQIVLADNKASDAAGYHTEALRDLLLEMTGLGIDMTSTLWDSDEIKYLTRKIRSTKDSDDDDEPTRADELQAKWQVKEGDIWMAGEHRVACCSSGDQAAVARLMDGKRARMVWTDPPYGVDVTGGSKGNRRAKLANDGNIKTAERVYIEALQAAITVPAAAIYVACPSSFVHHFIAGMETAGFSYHHMLVWVKDQLVLSRGDYHYKHEPVLFGQARPGDVHRSESVLYGWKHGGRHFFIDDRTNHTVFEIPRPRSSIEHPTMKPVPLVAAHIVNSSKPGDIVYDPFLGSGTSILGAEDAGRIGYGCELLPPFVAVTLERCAKIGLEVRRG